VSDIADDPRLIADAQIARFIVNTCPVVGCDCSCHYRANPRRRCQQGLPNPDGAYPDSSRDFIGQGAANLGASLFQGMPIGGSVSGTALNVSSGAKSRWANIISGLIVVAAILLFSQAVSLVAMPAMAGLLIVAGFQSINRIRFADVWSTGWAPRIVMLFTLVLTLILPLQQAVFLGVAALHPGLFLRHFIERGEDYSTDPRARWQRHRKTSTCRARQ